MARRAYYNYELLCKGWGGYGIQTVAMVQEDSQVIQGTPTFVIIIGSDLIAQQMLWLEKVKERTRERAEREKKVGQVDYL